MWRGETQLAEKNGENSHVVRMVSKPYWDDMNLTLSTSAACRPARCLHTPILWQRSAGCAAGPSIHWSSRTQPMPFTVPRLWDYRSGHDKPVLWRALWAKRRGSCAKVTHSTAVKRGINVEDSGRGRIWGPMKSWEARSILVTWSHSVRSAKI